VVPFVRVTRDKRGYERIYLMRASGQRGKAGSPRPLYVFRTPPGLKVGREPFDDAVRRMIEEQNPGVYFDWKKLSVILPPPPDVEYWRERRRAEKAAKQVRREESAAREAASPAAGQVVETDEDYADEEDGVDRNEANDELEPAERVGSTGTDDVETEDAAPDTTSSPDPTSVTAGPPSQSDAPRADGQRRRRRRRGGRGRKRHTPPEGSAQVAADPPKISDDPSKER